MTKYRIVPCIRNGIYYKTQVSGIFGWSDETESNIFKDNIFPTPQKAFNYLVERYGTTAKIVEYSPAD
jgi:hypothetical protein